MKHNSLISANGFHTPIASTTVKSSVLTTIFKPLLLLLLLMVGSSAMWADDYALNNPIGADGYYIVKWDCANSTWASSNSMQIGETFTFAIDITGNSYLLGIVNSGHTIAFAHYAGDGYEREYTADCFRLKQISGNIYGATYNFKKDKPDWDTQKIWARFWDGNNWDYPGKEIHSPTKNGLFKWATNTGATSPDFTSEQIAADGGMPNGHQRNGYAAPCACEETGGDPEPAEREISDNYHMRGDLWVKDNDGHWAGTSNRDLCPKPYRETDGTYTFSYIAPVANKNRFAVQDKAGSCGEGYAASKQTGSSNDVSTNSEKYIFNVSSPKQVDVTFYPNDGNKCKVLLSDYTTNTEGWYFLCEQAIGGISDNTNTAMANDGTLTLTNVAAGTYYFYIHNNASEKYWGFNKFGGCYVDQTNSAASLISEKTADKKFDGKEWPIKSVSDRKVKMVVSDSDAGKNVRVSFDGGKIVLTLQDPPAPAATYTVTLHPNNGGSNIERTNVPEGSTTSASELGLSSITYGNGTATWYTNAACTEPFTTVTSDMDLYAKWGVSGNYYFASSLQTASDAGETGNWNSGWAKQLNYASGTPGKCSYSFIAPAGRLPFELLTSTSGWSSIGVNNNLINNDASDVTVATLGGHFYFELSAPKKVTVSFDGKVSVNVEDYVFDNSKTWHVKTSWASSGGGNWNYNTVLTNSTNGGSVVLPVEAGDRSFIISTKTDDGNAQQVVGTETFNALYVDTSNPSSGFNWRMTNAKLEGSGNFDKQLPQADGNYWRNCAFHVNDNCNIRISFDGGKIRCDILPKYTVSFNSDGGSAVASQTVSEGNTASEPSAPTKDGYTFVKWQLNGVDYHFTETVTEDITLDAVWAYKAISSVALNESAHTTWLGNSNFVLTPTMTPSDLITKTVEWSSNASGVASVVDGTVHAEGVGTATITCTVTDQFDTQRSASCEVTVAACQMIVDNLYSMTVTGYNTSTGSSATLSGLWNESTDNDGPATFRIVKLKLYNNYVYDDNGTVKMSTDASLATAQWYEIPTGETYSPNWTGSSFALYEFKNVSTGRYMRRGNGRYGNNGDWYYYTTLADSRTTDGNQYKFFYDNTMGTHLVCREGADYNEGNTITELKKAFAIHNNNLNWAAGYSDHCAAPMVVCGYTNDPNGNTYTKLHETVVVDPSYPNPNYKASLVNGSYYRMNTDATVQANLAAPLVSGAVITVRLYADAATSVKLQKTDGTEIETIDLTVDTEREYTYSGSALVGESAFVIKAADNHAGIASIVVTRTYAASPENPVLTWDDGTDVTQSALEPAFQRIASSTLSSGAIHYISSDETVATVAADGTVTPLVAGNTTITATIEAEGCYDEASISYDVTLTEPSLQEAIDATPVSGTLTLTHDYNDDAVIDKAITINGDGHTIGDLKIEQSGDLTLSSGLTVRDFTICAKAGNTTTPAASGQVRNAATNLTCNRNAYFLYTVDPSDHVQYGWYDFTVPFPVNVMTGIKGIQDNVMKENFANEVDYAIMEYLGERKAQGQYPYQKFRGVMQPNQLYSITLDSRYNYNTVRFQKTADGALVAGDNVTLHEYAGSGVYTNLNGVGNGTLHHADAGISGDYVQVYQSGEKTFLTVYKTQYSFVVGTAFMVQVQEAGTMTLNQATHGQLLAPARQASAPATAIQIAREGQPFSDQLFISASETGGQAYTPGTDLAKAGDLGSANVPQIWTNAYNNPLCVHEAQLINGEASYNLSIYAPAADTYTLTSQNIPADYSLYLTQNGTMLTELSGTYTLDLNKGITTEYGLLLVETYKTPTGMEEPMSQESRVKSQKILRGGVLYILHNGKVYNAQGGKVCDL